ncbi:ABC transporter G family member 23-like isoform X2 [Venturia canescens]|uniref:ABC transporter G family member 23-like isoform X2 n=1 Tax=Venturia canescens TaxID=32260 RepID=UPI001C9C3277|nr:ABC transporter G family member 23-like isoform X2 [Venturia canescens]
METEETSSLGSERERFKFTYQSFLQKNLEFATMVAKEAIVVRNATKQYDSGTKIIDGLNMTVSRGSIYGLLGPSGCGKSTLLTCVVGIRKFNSGDLWVLGGQPGTRGSGIPGPRVGYMPQDISLVGEFTVIGALFYFGRINGLDDDTIEEQFAFLTDLFQLPSRNQLVKNLSGGQQRRVSFAAALIHDPELLILDEPTVGLDPILRENIWNFLADIAKTRGTTIVITTHYIEETKLADKIGLLRGGQLLAESSPSQLLAEFQCEHLEDAFLLLSERQKENQERGIRSPAFVGDTDDDANVSAENNNIENGKASFPATQKRRSGNFTALKFKALMIKNFLQFVRHPGTFLFAIVLPLFQTFIFFNAIGNDLQGLRLAVVNNEAGNCSGGTYNGSVSFVSNNETCDFVDISCRFLNGFNKAVAQNEFYDNIEEATQAVKNGKGAGTILIASNFSKALTLRMDGEIFDTTEEFAAAEIEVSLDMGNRQIGLFVEERLAENFVNVFENIVQECNLPKKLANLPIRFEEPIFGTKHQKYSSSMGPGFLMTVVFFLATSVSSSIIIADRHEGIWDRSLVQGVTTVEILTSHLLTLVSLILIQVILTLVMSIGHFGLECRGSLLIVGLLLFFTGFCGLCYGFLISIVSSSQTLANYISTGSFYPAILLCGCLWPLEGMPKVLRWVSFLIPTTLPSLALRGLMDKGYTVDDPSVYTGFLIVAAWIAVLLGVSFFCIRSKAG